MTPTYTWLKVIHVIAVIMWIGGGFAMLVIQARIAATKDRVALVGFLRGASFYGPRFSGGGSVVALLSGIGMVMVGHIGFKALWISIGLAGMVLHFIVGAGLIPRWIDALDKLVRDPNTSDADITARQRRFTTLTSVYAVLMFLVVLDMVLKPTL